MISVDELLNALEARNGYPLNTEQTNAVRHDLGPLWIIAGPGTGKTEVLVARCLRLMCCDAVAPSSILVTTFTQKAATNLQQRLAEGLAHLHSAYPALQSVDVSGLRIGTLHALCNDVMQEYRFEPYRNLRLLDDVESHMLFRGNVARQVRDNGSALLNSFRFLFGDKPQLNLWDITKGMLPLLNRVVEDELDLTRPEAQAAPWRQVAQFTNEYANALAAKHACDFASLQALFIRFLREPIGAAFLEGDQATHKPALSHILVDEYQDTNPIQESIYFELARRAPHNITVVGDDDQALYRFRGGSVDAMLSFGRMCQTRWAVTPTTVQLRDNYRSHNQIVSWCERFIAQSPAMRVPDSRAVGKLPLLAASGRNGAYPAVGFIMQQRITDVAQSFASTISGLLANAIIGDPSQCVLLLRTTREGPNGAGPYVDALRAANLRVYNPRSKSFDQQPEVRALLGTLMAVLDPQGATASGLMGLDVATLVADCRAEYRQLAGVHADLRDYVTQSAARLRTLPPRAVVTPAVPTILYRILSLGPFPGFQSDVEQDLRLSKVTRLLEAFCSQYGRRLNMDATRHGEVSNYWITQFYYVFGGYLSTFGIDDDEDEDAICPPGRVSVMTFHQAKGLEFDFVFVGHLGRSVQISDSVRMEEAALPLRRNPPVVRHSALQKAWHDDIRSYYVAYSRARHALVLLGTTAQFAKRDADTSCFGLGGGTAFRQTFRRL